MADRGLGNPLGNPLGLPRQSVVDSGDDAVELGECVYLVDQSKPLLELGGMKFLKTGNLIINERYNYPEVYERFEFPTNGAISGAITQRALPASVSWYSVTYGLSLIHI